MNIWILTCKQSDATQELEHCFIHSSLLTSSITLHSGKTMWRKGRCLERMGLCILATRHQLTHWLSVDLNEPRLLLWLRWGKSGPNCPSLRLPLLHTLTHTPRMWWTCMHRHADTQVTLMYNTRTSISDSVGGTPSSHSKVYVMNTHGPVYLQSVSDDTKEIKAETHFFFSDEVLSLSIPVKTWNAAVVVSSWFDLVSSDLLCFAAHPWLLSHSSSYLPTCLPACLNWILHKRWKCVNCVLTIY